LLKRTAALAGRVAVFDVVAIGLTLALWRGWTLVGNVLGRLEVGRLLRRELELRLEVQRCERHLARRMRNGK
jgi:hypothetical protein